MGFNPFKSIDRVLDKGSNALQSAASSVRNEFNDTTRTIRRTTSSAVNTVRREIGETSQAVKGTTNNFANTARREFNETTQAVKRTTNRAVNTARREIGETSQAVRRTSNNFANTARREFNETTQAVRRTTNTAVNTARREIGETSQAVRRTTRNVANTARREIGETSQAVSRTARNFANTARQVNLSDVGHTVLDGAGFIPVVGAAADVVNGVWYAAEGNWTDAGFALGAAVPFAGDAVAAAKGARRIAGAANAVGRATNVADEAGDIARVGGSRGVFRPLGARGGTTPIDVPNQFGTHRGTASGRPFFPTESGGPVRELSTNRLKIKPRAIDVVEHHVSRFGDDPANKAQIQRLRDITAGRLRPTEADTNFYAHELREFVRYRKQGWQTGVPADSEAASRLWNNTHTATLEDYSLKEGKGVLYHSSIETSG